MINLDETQRKTVTTWIAEGLKLSEIQSKLGSELGVNLTYMEVRFLVDDLKLTPKDAEPVQTADLGSAPGGGAPQSSAAEPFAPGSEPAQPGQVSVTVDSIARPGTVASGNVTFSDGNAAEWYLDESGRLGLLPRVQGYRPAQQDVLAFQAQLQTELGRLGM